MASYNLKGEYLCQSCFRKRRELLESKGIEIIFPSFQEPKYPYIKSNMLTHVGRGQGSIGHNWGKRKHQGRSRSTKSRKGRGKTIKPVSVPRRSKKTIKPVS